MAAVAVGSGGASAAVDIRFVAAVPRVKVMVGGVSAESGWSKGARYAVCRLPTGDESSCVIRMGRTEQ
jgi:hypothetical protein